MSRRSHRKPNLSKAEGKACSLYLRLSVAANQQPSEEPRPTVDQMTPEQRAQLDSAFRKLGISLEEHA